MVHMMKRAKNGEFKVAYKTKRGAYKELKVVALWWHGDSAINRITIENDKFKFGKE